MVGNPIGFFWGLLFLFFFLPLLISLTISIGMIFSIKSNSNLTTKLIYAFTALIVPLLLTIVLMLFISYYSFVVFIILFMIILGSPLLISMQHSNKYRN